MFSKFLFPSAAAWSALVLLTSTAGAVTIDLVPVGNPGNGNDPETGYGSVADPFLIGQYEVTAGQYTEFLNAVADTDTYGLYNSAMWSEWNGCKIERNGSPGSYTYSVATDRANRPVTYVSWGDAARFCNWLQNGQPNTGVQDLTTTEDGAYFLNGANDATTLMTVTRQSNATWFLPTENQWYKAAYHKNDGQTANYWDFPTQTDDPDVLCNDLTEHDPGNNANFYQNGYAIGSPYWTTEVGEFENSGSACGTFDQGGNVYEWNETPITASWRGARGGGWRFESPYFMRASTRRFENYSIPTAQAGGLGFRVARVPEPIGGFLAISGLLVALSGRWRNRCQ